MQSIPDRLTANMLRYEYYVVTTTPARSPEISALLGEHLDYQVKLEREGKLFGAGPFYEEGEEIPAGGMIIYRAANFEEARALAEQDPLHLAKLRQYTIRKWMMNEGSMAFTIRYSDRSVVVGK